MTMHRFGYIYLQVLTGILNKWRIVGTDSRQRFGAYLYMIFLGESNGFMWQLKEQHLHHTRIVIDIHDDEGYGCEFQFNADGTLTYIETMLDATTSKVRDSGTYKLDGNRLMLYWAKSETWSNYSQQWIVDDTSTETAVVKISLKGNQLTLYPDKSDDSSKPVTFTRE